MADIESERIKFCKQIYEKYNKALGDIDDMYNRYDIIKATPDLWINGMYQYMNESERQRFYNLVNQDTSINSISRNAILSRRDLFFDNNPKEYPILKHLTDEQWKVMSEIGYPYAPGNAKEHEAAPIPEMIYWRIAAGFISREDAVRAFSTTGYTVGEDPQRTREILSEFNNRYGKLDSNFNPLGSSKKPQIPNTKEELIALVGNDYKRVTDFGSLFVTETEDYGRKESRKVSGISIKDNNIQFMGIHAPKSWEALTPDGQKKVCQWVYDNLELTRQLPDMFYQALDVLKDAETATGKQKEGYDMFQRVRDRLYFGDPTYVPDYRSWAGKVSNDFRYFIQPTELEKSTHYKELADALAIMPLVDIEKFVKEVENHPLRKEVCAEIQKQNDLRDAKQVVHDRIVTPSARRFTPEQIDTLKHYRAMFSADTDTRELYTRLYEEAIKDADVARKPEKWQTDTLRELNDLAEGITREETRGLHK